MERGLYERVTANNGLALSRLPFLVNTFMTTNDYSEVPMMMVMMMMRLSSSHLPHDHPPVVYTMSYSSSSLFSTNNVYTILILASIYSPRSVFTCSVNHIYSNIIKRKEEELIGIAFFFSTSSSLTAF